MSGAAKKNLAFAAAVLALAAGLFFWQRSQARAGQTALVEYGEAGQTLRIPLNRDARYDIDTGLLTIHLEVAGGAIRFVDSPCADHLCEGFGQLRSEGDWAACLPAKALVTVGK